MKEGLHALLYISYNSNPIYSKSTAFVLLSVILLLLMNRYVDNYKSVPECNQFATLLLPVQKWPWQTLAAAELAEIFLLYDHGHDERDSFAFETVLSTHSRSQISQNCLVTRHCLFPVLLSTHATNPVLLSWNDFEWG